MSQTKKYGIIAGNPVDNSNDTYQVTDMVEKPSEKNAPSNMAIIGRYILTPEIFNSKSPKASAPNSSAICLIVKFFIQVPVIR